MSFLTPVWNYIDALVHPTAPHNMTDVIVRHGRNGSVLFVSPAAESLAGVQVNELYGDGLFDRVHVADRPAYLAALADAVAGTERSLEFRIRRGAGANRFVWVEMRCRPLEPNGARKPADREAVSVLRDVNERKTREQAVSMARAETENASASRSHFIATMSHELRTPLNAIIGFSEMLTDDSLEVSAERKREYAKLINDSGRHLLSVVNGILDVSRMETGNFEITPEPFSPASAIATCIELLALKAREAELDLTTHIAPDLPDVTGDRRAFKQILINLISNAVKFTPRGGKVTVTAACEGPKLVVTVEDTGIGIAEADLPRLGEAFFQARTSYDRPHDGTGLGLSIVKGLVHLHGGDVDIRSRPGEGTRVTVRLPLDCEGERPTSDPIRLAERNRDHAPAANNRVRKSA